MPTQVAGYVRFSNRPIEVKRFQAIHDCGVGINRGLVLLFGLGARPFQHGIRGRAGTIFLLMLGARTTVTPIYSITSSARADSVGGTSI